MNVGYLPVGKIQTASQQIPAYPAGSQIPFYLGYIHKALSTKPKK